MYEREILVLVQNSDASGFCQASHILQFFVDNFHLFLREHREGVSTFLSQSVIPLLTAYEVKILSPLNVGERYLISIEKGPVEGDNCVFLCFINTLQGLRVVSGVLHYVFSTTHQNDIDILNRS